MGMEWEKKHPYLTVCIAFIALLFLMGSCSVLVSRDKSSELTVIPVIQKQNIPDYSAHGIVQTTSTLALTTTTSLIQTTLPHAELVPLQDHVSNELYKVTRVIDGDTIELENGEKVRYLGIDTPETTGDCFATQATNRNKELVLGKIVSLESDATQGNRDRYNRLLRYVYVDGTEVNAILVLEGYAKVYLEYPVKKTSLYISLEDEAKSSGYGMWETGACTITTTTREEVYSAQDTEEGFSCNIKKSCDDMVSCREAYYYLNTCDKKSLDRNNDTVPCEETICKGYQ
jgi:micrococcal nuclease